MGNLSAGTRALGNIIGVVAPIIGVAAAWFAVRALVTPSATTNLGTLVGSLAVLALLMFTITHFTWKMLSSPPSASVQ